LYIHGQFRVASPPSAFHFGVLFSCFWVFPAVLGDVTWVFVKPGACVAVATLEVTGMSSQPSLLVSRLPLLLASGRATGVLSTLGPWVGIEQAMTEPAAPS
jgi:hypothetical protein